MRRPIRPFRPTVTALEGREVPSISAWATLNVPMTTAAPAATTMALTAGRSYRVVASGYAILNDPSGLRTDAEYVLRGPGPDDYGRGTDGPTDNGVRLGGVIGAGKWGGFRSDHVYTQSVVGTGAPLTVRYQDLNPDSYADNANGSLKVTVYESVAPVGVPDDYDAPDYSPLVVDAAHGVLVNDGSPDGAPLSSHLVAGPAPGVGTVQLESDGSFVFTPGAQFSGSATFQYGLGTPGLPNPVGPILVRIGRNGLVAQDAKLNRLSFNSDHMAILPDAAGDDRNPAVAALNPPHWLDANGDGKIAGKGEHAYPVSFTRDSKLKVRDVMFGVGLTGAKVLKNATELRARATADTPDGVVRIGYDQNNPVRAEFRASQTGGTLTVPAAASDDKLTAKTAYYKDMPIKWQLSIDGGRTWFTPATGTSKNTVYVTFAKPPAGTALFETLLAHAAKYASGLDKRDDVIAGIFSGFDTKGGKGGVTDTAGNPLKYYGKWSVKPSAWQNLIAKRDGQCDDWAALLVAMFNAQGVGPDANSVGKPITGAKEIIKVVPKDPKEWFLVKNWEFGTPNLPKAISYADGGTYNFFNIPSGKDTLSNPPLRDSVAANKMVWKSNKVAPAVTDTDGLAGQNNPNPVPMFSNHVVVQLGGTIYDPSYGVTYASIKDFEDKAIAGYVREAPLLETTLGVDVTGDGKVTKVPVHVFLFRKTGPLVGVKQA